MHFLMFKIISLGQQMEVFMIEIYKGYRTAT